MDFGFTIFVRRLWGLLTSLPFWMMTFSCNLAVGVSAFIFHTLEFGHNDGITSFLDSLWWSFSTVTTVGYGDITPQTVGGKVIGILLMIGGTGLFATYTAIFANAMLGVEFSRLGRKVNNIGKSMAGIQSDEILLEQQIGNLNTTLSRLEDRLEKLEKDSDKDKG